MLRDAKTFDDVIFSDECIAQVDQNSTVQFRKIGEPKRSKPKPKHPFKLCIWAAILKRGPSPILIFKGLMDGQFYSEEILKGTLRPFISQHFPDGHRFQQDNDPKHTSKVAQATMNENDINWWKTPAESPDLNHIEMIWACMKRHLREEKKPSNKEQLIDGINEYWDTVTPEMCTKFISHLYKVIPDVIRAEGKASGH